MKIFAAIFFVLFFFKNFFAQQNYCNFENIRQVNFGLTSGALDTASANPFSDNVNPSAYCGKYIRDTGLYDNIKLFPFEKLVNVTPYANNTFQTPKIKMKMYSSAPSGTRIELQLGTKYDDNYPSGIHSEYIGLTTVQNEWELINFHFAQIPQQGVVSPTDIDKIVVFFAANSNSTDTFYFDDITGPELVSSAVASTENNEPFKLFQNIPNPAKETTLIKFHIASAGYVTLKIYDLLGNEILTLVDEELKAGVHSASVETDILSEGLYFYILKKDEISRSMKMIVSKK